MADSLEYNSIVAAYQQKIDNDEELDEAERLKVVEALRAVNGMSPVERAPYERTLSGLRTSVEMRLNREKERGAVTAAVQKQLLDLQTYLPETLREMSDRAIHAYDQKQMDSARLRQAEADTDQGL